MNDGRVPTGPIGRMATSNSLGRSHGHWIGNDSDKIRSPGVAVGAVVYHLTLDPFFTILSYDDWLQGACHGTQDHECPVWLYVNGGKATAIVEQFFA